MNCDEALDAGREIKRAVSLLFSPGDVAEVRALSDFKTYSGYFKDFDRLAAEALALESAGVNGIYVTLNQVNPVLFSRRADRVKPLSKKDATTSDADIVRRCFLPVDIDPVRPSGLSSSDDEHDYALLMARRVADFLGGLGFSEPLIADSGNGAHLLYRISLPNDGDSALLVKHCLEVLDALFSDGRAVVDKGNYNASRIWKLYGTSACKGDDTAERPHRRSGIISAPDNLTAVSRANLVKLSEFVPGRNKKNIPPPAVKGSAGSDLSGWLNSHGISVKSEKPWQGGTLFVLDECPFSSAHKDGAFAVQFANGAIFAGCHHNSCGAGRQRWGELRAMYEKKEEKKAVLAERLVSEPVRVISESGSSSRERALEILRNGDPLKFMLDVFGRCHIGDRTVAECMIMSVASQSVDNTMGLHVSVSGNSGKGKTHVCKCMLKLIPDEYKLSGSVSDKALYYNTELLPGTVFWFDDTALSEDFQEVLKNATSNFDSKIEHMTLTAERKLKVCTIPERCVWWLSKVDDAGDDQVLNRMLTVWIDDSAEQDGRVLEHLRAAESKLKRDVSDEGDILVCREIWRILKESLVYVTVPFSERIRFLGFSNRRNPSVLFDLIKCHALLFSMQRREVDDLPGVKTIEADLSDFYAALDVYKKIEGESGGLTSNLSKNEARVLSFFETMGWDYATTRMIQDSLDLSYYQVRRIFHGYSARGTKYPGLLSKCPAVSYVDTVVPEDTEAGTVRKREQRFLFNYEVYRGWINSCSVVLDDDDDGSGDGPDGSFGSVADEEVRVLAGSESATWHGDNTAGVPSANLPLSGDIQNSRDICGFLDGQNTTLHSSPGAQHGFFYDDAGYGCCISKMSAIIDDNPVFSRLYDYRGDLRGVLDGTFGVYESAMLQTGIFSGGCALVGSPDLTFNNMAGSYDAGSGERVGLSGFLPGGTVGFDGLSGSLAEGYGGGLNDSGGSSVPGEEYKRFRFKSSDRDRNSVIPLPGLFKSGDFSRVYKDLGACHICGKGRVRFRCEEFRVNVCDACMVRIMREDGWYRGR